MACRFDDKGGLVLELYRGDVRSNGYIVYMTADDVVSQAHILSAWAKRRTK